MRKNQEYFSLETVPSELGRKHKHFLIETNKQGKGKCKTQTKTRNTPKQTDEAAEKEEEEGNKPKQNILVTKKNKTKQIMP